MLRSLPSRHPFRLRDVSRLAFLGILGIAILAGCAEAPIAQKYAAKAALQEAREVGAETLAPLPYQAAEEAFASGIRALNLESRKMRWNRAYERSESQFDAAIRRAQLAQSRARQQQEQSRARAQRLLARADTGFDQMNWLFTYIPPRSQIRSDVRRAQVSYAEAKGQFKEGNYMRAVAAAHQANIGIDAAYSRFSRFIRSSADPARTAQYGRWVKETITWSARHNSRAIIVDKMRRTLSLVVDGRRERTYRAELGVNGTLDKAFAGDRATPEGQYKVTEKRGPRQTRWYKALLLNYPNADDLKRFERARRRGQISRRARPGGLIEIHGEGGRGGDWTDGCVALLNRDIDDLFDRVSVGTPVTIVGFESDESIGRFDSRASRTAPQRGTPSRGSTVAGGIR